MNGAMFSAAVRSLRNEGHHVETSDLYRMGFNPVSDRRNFTTVANSEFLKLQAEEIYANEHAGFAPDIEGEIRKLENCDLLILQFPLWWFGMPAILKGWIDRVFAMGRTYGNGMFRENGAFRGKRALVSVTTGASQDVFSKTSYHGTMDAVLVPLHRGVLELTGFSILEPQINHAPIRVDDATRKSWIESWEQRLKTIGTEQPIDLDRDRRTAPRA
jgi:NAD(P)H dehydrogenase (quinone)